MSSKWSRLRRQKRKYDSYLHEGARASSSNVSQDDSYLHEGASSSNVGEDFIQDESLSNYIYSGCTSSSTSSSDSSDSEVEPDAVPSDSVTSENASSQSLLRDWAINHQISHSALKGLLKILKSQYDPQLPSDPRTLCETPTNLSYQTKKISGGEYFHFGITNSITEFLKTISDLKVRKLTTIFLRINCDGIPLFKSSGKQFWPILVQFCTDYDITTYSKPVPVGIYLGNSKPGNVEEYLEEFISEMCILKDGYEFKGVKYLITIQCFICDAPARQYLKSIKSHSGYSSCERCQQHGKYDKTITLPELNAPLRTDSNFASMTDSDHHKGPSPLLQLDVGLVSQFVLDPMHLVYLGVMRKLLNLWLKGPLPTRIGSQSKGAISRKLEEMSKYMPSEFSRKPRCLNELDRYKATEFRAFLLYTGPVCLKKNIHESLYKNFLLLSVSMRLLSGDLNSKNLLAANKYLNAFITHFGNLFGSRHLVYNIHNLCHLTDDVNKYGPIDRFSAFPFENYLGSLKRLLRKPNCILSQVINRVYEQKKSKSEMKKVKYPYTVLQHSNGPVLQDVACSQFRALHLEKFCIRLNSAGIMVNNHVGKVVNILQYENDPDTYILYHLYEHYEDLFNYPVKSGSIGIYVVAGESKTQKICSYKDIQKKYLLFPHEGNIAALPLIHSVHAQ